MTSWKFTWDQYPSQDCLESSPKILRGAFAITFKGRRRPWIFVPQKPKLIGLYQRYDHWRFHLRKWYMRTYTVGGVDYQAVNGVNNYWPFIR